NDPRRHGGARRSGVGSGVRRAARERRAARLPPGRRPPARSALLYARRRGGPGDGAGPGRGAARIDLAARRDTGRCGRADPGPATVPAPGDLLFTLTPRGPCMEALEAPATRPLKIVREPRVYVVGRQQVNAAAIERFLADHAISWQTDTEIG